jgi:secondary thiamine-phosphate synthase enzyme
MRQSSQLLNIHTDGPGLTNITSAVCRWVKGVRVENGLLTLFIRHTSASLTINENADPAVLEDLENFFLRIVSRDPQNYRHGAEGPDDMPAHIRTALTQTHLSIPVEGGAPALGTWQGIYLFEHRDRPHSRTINMHLIGE